jgi:hypothetical protein
MRSTLLGITFTILMAGASPLAAQEQPTGTAAPPTATESPAPTAGASQLTEAQLAQLVAPIALYPDELLADVLMASTYPVEVVEADRWVDANKSLTGTDLTSALDQEDWHASVKSLVATPSVLDMMSNQLGWTQQLGTAVLGQQSAVMAAVQALRAQAQAANQLQSNDQQTVSAESEGSQQVIVIKPTNPGVVYVPYYDPAVVYGRWAYPDYLPYYWAPPVGVALGRGLAFGVGFSIGDPMWHGYWGGYWGGFDWGHGNIVVHDTVNIDGNVHVNVNAWQHDGNDRSDDYHNAYRGDPDGYDHGGDGGHHGDDGFRGGGGHGRH